MAWSRARGLTPHLLQLCCPGGPCSQGVPAPWGSVLPGGQCSLGVCAPRGVHAPWGSLLPGGLCSLGVRAP